MDDVCCEKGGKRIHVVAGIILDGKKILSVRKKGKEHWHIPGGKHKYGETHEETLARELGEELGGIRLNKSRYFAQVIEPAIWEGGEVVADIYFADIEGKIKPGFEIAEIRWFGLPLLKEEKMGSILEERVIPQLAEKGLL